ncbi:MAG TPA: hypothetical protein VKD47_09285 [Miltoncostaeaceae bacterium]|nr:hypothetical protein [Miltoncostaeaceae bacterium]
MAILLNLALAPSVSIGPTWLLPSVEGALLVVLIIVAPRRATAHSRVRRLTLGLTGLVTLATVVSVGLLVHELVQKGQSHGERLLLSGAVLWVNNVLLFGIWFWEMDRGGPVERFLEPHTLPDFQYPQMENPEYAHPNWRPGFLDYLYTSLTNATAFSPTDTMPLTPTAKIVMATQSLTALLTIGLIVARAVNILGT